MRTAIRSLLTLATLLASCTMTTPAFAQASSTSSGFAAMDARASAPAPIPDAPVPAAPSAPAEIPAIVDVDERDPREKIVDDWFTKHFHGLGPHLTEYLHGRLRAAVEELKALLLELPLS